LNNIVALLGDYYHPVESIKLALENSLAPNMKELPIQIDYCDTTGLVEALEARPDMLVIFKEDRLNPQDAEIQCWMNEEIGLAIRRYVEQGGSLLAWHSGLASYPVDGAYVKLLKGYFEYHPSEHNIVTYRSFEGKSATGVEFSIKDEHYFVYCEREQTEIFLYSTSVDGNAIAGWRHEISKGRVCCLTPAHTGEGLLDENLVALLRGCIQWCS
jgi:hypothetical protein